MATGKAAIPTATWAPIDGAARTNELGRQTYATGESGDGGEGTDDEGRGRGGPARNRRPAAALMDELAGKAEVAKAAAGEGRKKLESSIREQPLIAVSIAALAGFPLAALLRR